MHDTAGQNQFQPAMGWFLFRLTELALQGVRRILSVPPLKGRRAP